MIPGRAFVATATGNFADILGNTGPTVVAGWYVSETAGSTAGAQLLDGYVAAPGAATTALVATGTGNLTAGAYLYKVTFVTATGETDVGTASASVTVDSSHKQITVSAIPTFSGSPASSALQRVTSRKLYRTVHDGSTYKLLATLSDNTTTTYTDNIADASLGATGPSSNATGFVIAQWDFAAKGASVGEFDNGFESTYPGVPIRLNVTSGAVRMALFGR